MSKMYIKLYIVDMTFLLSARITLHKSMGEALFQQILSRRGSKSPRVMLGMIRITILDLLAQYEAHRQERRENSPCCLELCVGHF